MRTRTMIFGLVGCLLLFAIPALAQIPRTMNYQGSLKTLGGAPVTGSVSMTFALHDALTGGAQLWAETQTVAVTDGIYSVILGSSAPLNLAFDTPYYLQVDIWNDTTSQYERLNPRQPLTSVPYAINAAGLDGITIKNGNVGIGTTFPVAKVTVPEGSRISLDDNADDRAIFVPTGEGEPLVLSNHSAASNPTIRFRNDANGEDAMVVNIASGTLDVTGNINLGTYLTFDGNNTANKLIMGGSDLRGMGFFPNTDAVNSQAWVNMWGNDGSARAGELDLAGSYINFRYGVTTANCGIVGMLLAPTGNVGIGTMTPEAKLDVAGNINLVNYLTFDGNSTANKLIMGGSDLRGMGLFPNTDAVNSQSWISMWGNDGSARAGELDLAGSYINFRYGVTTANCGIVGMILSPNGNVGIGTATPQYALDVVGTIRGTTVTSSDARLKEDMTPLDSVLPRLTQLRGITFRPRPVTPSNISSTKSLENRDHHAFSAPGQVRILESETSQERRYLGVIAQEVEQVFPEAVFTDATGYKSVAYDMLIAPLIEAVKELNARNDTLAAEINTLKSQNAEFERRLQALEAVK